MSKFLLWLLMLTNLQDSIFGGELNLLSLEQLPTTGARSVKSFMIDQKQYLAIAQLSEDIPGRPLSMKGGNSDIPTKIFEKGNDGKYKLFQELPSHGGEDCEFFSIGDRKFLAVAQLREGNGPYKIDIPSVIYEWDYKQHGFIRFQEILTYGAHQWHHFTIDGEHYLAMAMGIDLPEAPIKTPPYSTIYRWDGQQFVHWQNIPGRMGYQWESFELDDQTYLVYIDHSDCSAVYRWNRIKKIFELFQSLKGHHALRDAHYFTQQGEHYLALASLLSSSVLYKRNHHTGMWEHHQVLSSQIQGESLGGHNVLSYKTGEGELYLILLNFITGSRQNPKVDLNSSIFKWNSVDQTFHLYKTFSTNGATDLTIVRHESTQEYDELIITQSLHPQGGFNQPTQIFKITR